MKQSRIKGLVCGFLLALLPPCLSHSGDEAQGSSIFIDPDLEARDIPPAPSDADRAEVLRALQSVPAECGVGLEARKSLPPAVVIGAQLDKVRWDGDPVTTLAHIVLTEKSLSLSDAQTAVDVLAWFRTAEANDWASTIYRVSPIIGRRIMAGYMDPATAKPDFQVENGFSSGIRSALEAAARRWKNAELIELIRRQR